MNQNTSVETFATPSYRVIERDSGFQAEVILPGVPRENLEVRVENDVLQLTARRQTRPQTWKPLHRELRPSHYRFGLRLGRDVDSTKITAELKNGVLLLGLPKLAPTLPVARAIEVN